jgi:hypothetical protein
MNYAIRALTASIIALSFVAACGGGGSSSPPPPVERVGHLPLIGDIVINEFLADPDSDANCDGVTNTAQDEFIELVSTTTDTLDLSYVTIWDAASMKHTFPRGAYLLPLNAAVVYGGGSPNCAAPAGVSVTVASSGLLGLNNAGDTITVQDENGIFIDTTSYVTASNDVSFNLMPDVIGAYFDLHTNHPGSVGNYSPATRATGSVFP